MTRLFAFVFTVLVGGLCDVYVGERLVMWRMSALLEILLYA